MSTTPPQEVIRCSVAYEDGEFLLSLYPRDTDLAPRKMRVSAGEAHALNILLNNEKFERPLSHDLLHDAMQVLRLKVVQSRIDFQEDRNHRGRVFVEKDQQCEEVGCTPVVAVLLSLKAHAPLFFQYKSGQGVEAKIKNEDAPTSDLLTSLLKKQSKKSKDPLELREQWTEEMELAAKEERYEDAARLRDKIQHLDNKI